MLEAIATPLLRRSGAPWRRAARPAALSVLALVALPCAACCCPAWRTFESREGATAQAPSVSPASPASPTDSPPEVDESQYPRAPLHVARRGFQTQLVSDPLPESDPPPTPPAGVLELVRYAAPAGALRAYLTPDPHDGSRHPAVVWVHGGWGGLDDLPWQTLPRENDQSASAFRSAGLVLGLPSFRGQNDNPGRYEGFWGEVDDLAAFVEHVAALPYVDPARVYVAEHSTGGTMALLAATSTDRARAFFGIGAAPGACNHHPENLPFVVSPDGPECRLRSWMEHDAAIRRPSFYIEGGTEPGASLMAAAIAEDRRNARVQVDAVIVPGGNHFDVLEPTTRLLVRKILADTGPTCTIGFGAEDVTWLRSQLAAPDRPAPGSSTTR